jgi:hypothetical protein
MKAAFNSKLLLASLLLLVTISTSFSGCVAPRHRVVVIEAGHAHTDHCGHYFHRGRWRFARGHHHGPRCGHHFVGGVWIIK